MAQDRRVNPKTFFGELKRRNVYKVAVAYIIAGWALAQGFAQVLPVFAVPIWVIQLLVVLIILGLPVALGLAWAFELTPEGIKRTETADAMPEATRRKKYVWIFVVVIGGLLSIGLFFLGRYTAGPTQHAAVDTSVKSIAVLPFEPDRAIELLQKLVIMPGYINYARLKLYPMWNPLRGDPRFEKIVNSLAPKDHSK